jgi:hypothetical protein
MSFGQFCRLHRVDRWERARLAAFLIALRTSNILLGTSR